MRLEEGGSARPAFTESSVVVGGAPRRQPAGRGESLVVELLRLRNQSVEVRQIPAIARLGDRGQRRGGRLDHQPQREHLHANDDLRRAPVPPRSRVLLASGVTVQHHPDAQLQRGPSQSHPRRPNARCRFHRLSLVNCDFKATTATARTPATSLGKPSASQASGRHR